jgi:HK97 family phage major capsid protein
MDLEKMRARLEEIQAKLNEYKGVEDFTDEIVNEINSLNEEFEGLTKKIEAKEKLEATLGKADASKGRKTGNTPKAKIEVTPSKKEKMGGFNNFGEFLSSVRNAARGDMDSRFKNTMFERQGEDGGFLVPEEMMTDITKKIQGDEALLPRTRQITVSGNSLSLPTDETQPFSGGIQSYWTEEGAAITASDHKFGKARWQLNKLAALVKVTDELLEDSAALESYIRVEAPQSLTYQINKAILVGDGVGKPTGLLNSGFKVTVAKESGQAADTVLAENVIKMYTRMIPSSRPRAVWYINAEVEPQLRLLKDGDGNYIYLAPGSQLNQNPYGLLMGRPVVPMLGGMPQLGDEGDIVFADLNYYYTILKTGGVQQAISSHLYFDQAIQAYRFIFRIDGSCPFKSPVQVENGNYEMSGFVTLADRA